MDPNQFLKHIPKNSLPPVHLWNPPFCGDIDINISKNGQWFHNGSPIGRIKLVQLFSKILKKEDDDYFLVTPVEKVRIQVECFPFVAVLLSSTTIDGVPTLIFTDNLDNQFIADQDHPISVDINLDTNEPVPKIHVRDGLFALINRAVFYQLVELSTPRTKNDQTEWVVQSAGQTFQLGTDLGNDDD